ncbi:MAG: PLDc N-terminal domain-containing protein [Rubrivivax sp.]|nr:PLDc N-terminal domain-containing protein [Rubrivivax sp.]MBK8526201.1 PLDc N-terminal domain-containing protein [Rubrivivax sp.]
MHTAFTPNDITTAPTRCSFRARQTPTTPTSSVSPASSALEHAAFVCGGLLIYVLLTRIDHQRRHPAAALAWVICIAAFPYLGLPAFLFFGSRQTACLQARPATHRSDKTIRVQATRVNAMPGSTSGTQRMTVR